MSKEWTGAEGGRSGQGQREEGVDRGRGGADRRKSASPWSDTCFSPLFSSQGFLFSIGVQWFDYDMLGGACVHPVGSLLKFSKL